MLTTFPRPVILVSRCLGFAACRYNGQQLVSPLVEMLRPHADCIAVCPEMEAELGVPRQPIRLCQLGERVEVLQPASGRKVTGDLEAAVDRLTVHLARCDGAILKGRSPSCGLHDAKVYQGKENPRFLRWDSGVFAARVLEQLGHKAVEDEQRLSNLALREHFLIKLYAWARFRSIAGESRMADLVDFHSRYKLLFLACNQARFRAAGSIAANHARLSPELVFQRYGEELGHILARPFSRKAMVNTLYHALGWVSEGLSTPERQFIASTIEEYRDERVPLQAVTRLLEAQALRFGREYLLSQTLLRPFPGELADLSDSGRGRAVA